MSDQDPKSNGRFSRLGSSTLFSILNAFGFGLGNLITLVAILGAVITVYADIRSNLAVNQNQMEELSRGLSQERALNLQFEVDMRAQLSQVSKDVAYLSGMLGK